MLIRKFDFFSSPPQMYFLQKKTNKKLFGGILFIIYFLVMLIVIIFYILDFHLNDKYDIKYSIYKNFTNNNEENNKNDDLIQNLNFTISLRKYSKDFKETELNYGITIYDNDFNFISPNTVFSRNPSNLILQIGYLCSYENSIKNDTEDLFYILTIGYSGYKIDHQNNNIPLEKNSNKYPFFIELYFSFNKVSLYEINWGYIKYKEERGLLGLFDKFTKNKKEYSSIDIDYINQVNTDTSMESMDIDGGIKLLAIIRMNLNNNQYIEYTRIKKTILDIFASIGALFSSIFTIFKYIFDFYSKNYDNYKIIKSILSEPKTIQINSSIKMPRSKTIKFENINRKNIIKNDNQSFDTSKTVPFISKGFNIQKKNVLEKRFNFKYNFDFIEINFIHFLLNHIYFKRKNRRKEQKVIDICNNILFKYISIEYILYNQIIFESLLKDYKWNDNNLKIIWNNNLIKKLNLNN